VFKPLYGMCIQLNCTQSASAIQAQISDEHHGFVCGELSGGDHSYGILTNGAGYEIVRITCVAGVVQLERGYDGTTAREWTSCDHLKFDWVPSAMTEAAAVEQGDALENFICGLVSDSLDITDDAADCDNDCTDCTKRIELKACDPVSFVVGNQEYTFADGCLTATNASASDMLTDGVFENATVTVVDGKIVDVRAGTAIVKNSCSPCCE